MKKCFMIAAAVMAALLLTSCTSAQSAAEASRSASEEEQLDSSQNIVAEVKVYDHEAETFSLEDYSSDKERFWAAEYDMIETSEKAVDVANVYMDQIHIPIAVHHYSNNVWLVDYGQEEAVRQSIAEGSIPCACSWVALDQTDGRVIALWHDAA